ncbi:lamin tail domain-containing protein [Brachybacterium sp. GPGPB12]|uniref:lamin tail domain-containing protein n=1 Tax=Brachybacterium sp. GPGPB12 TaxID=3023517 RepID=UPI0031344D87
MTVDAGEHGTFEAPYAKDEESGDLVADVTLPADLCATEASPIPLTITTDPAAGTSIETEPPVSEDCGGAADGVVVPGDLQINEIYGGGGNSGSTFTHDFVELVNTSDQPIDLAGLSLQYASATGTFNSSGVLALEGTVPAGGTFLIQLAKGAGGARGAARAGPHRHHRRLRHPGRLRSLGLRRPPGLHRCDLRRGPGRRRPRRLGRRDHLLRHRPRPAHHERDLRRARRRDRRELHGFRHRRPDAHPVGRRTDPEEPEEPGETVEASIAEIQGTGAQSPMVGKNVVTEGVVTAVYATGGLNGYVIQTGGTGGALDFSTHKGSTAVFVHSPETASQVAIGDSVRVTGEVSEYYDSTQISVGAEGLERLEQSLEPAEPATLAGGFPTEEARRESIEHMLYLPGAEEFTVTDVYSTNRFGEVGLAIGDQPLQQAGDIMRPGAEATAYYESRDALKVLAGRRPHHELPEQPHPADELADH